MYAYLVYTHKHIVIYSISMTVIKVYKKLLHTKFETNVKNKIL